MRVAGLDFGTNTFLCLICDVEIEAGHAEIKRVLHDESQVVRLGQGVAQNRRFHPDALKRAKRTLERFSHEIRRANVSKVLAVATSATRDASDREVLIQMGRQLGIPIEVISGPKEAELTFKGALEGAPQPMTVVDVGGGSTEITWGTPGQGQLDRFSVQLGAVRLFEQIQEALSVDGRWSDDILKELREQARDVIRAGLEPMAQKRSDFQSQLLVAVAGTPTTLGALIRGESFDARFIHGMKVQLQVVDEWIQKLARLPLEERTQLPGMEPKRADVLPAGLICLSEAMRALNANEFEISVRGLRFGVAQWIATRKEL